MSSVHCLVPFYSQTSYVIFRTAGGNYLIILKISTGILTCTMLGRNAIVLFNELTSDILTTWMNYELIINRVNSYDILVECKFTRMRHNFLST